MRAPFLLPPLPAAFVEDGRRLLDEPWLGGYLDHLSASGIRLLRVCPRAWQQRYIFGRKERPGEALTLGKAVHLALEYNHTAKITSFIDKPVVELVQYFHDSAWPFALEEDGGQEEIRWDNTPDSVRADGERVTRAYHTAVSPRIQPVAVEKKFEIVIPGVAVPLWGFIDVEEAANTVDVKTGKQVQKKPDANWRMQGVIYSAASGKPTHFHSVSRAQTPSIATPLEEEAMVVDLRDSQRALVERVIQDHAAQIEFFFNRYGPEETWPVSGLFSDYKGGRACDYCGFRGDCPAFAHERNVMS